jgi:D-inositol-3-phosphate glycosyltransferase
MDLEDQIDFIGQVDHTELPLYYNAADVCVVPSYYESFGLVALESMACGTPVVATRVGGLSTIVHHGRTGYLKSWRCPESFANSLEMIISNDDLQQSMGEAARKRAEGMGWDNVAALMWNEYDSLIGNPTIGNPVIDDDRHECASLTANP